MSTELIVGVATLAVVGYVIAGTLMYTYGDVKCWEADACGYAAFFWPVVLPMLLLVLLITHTSRSFRAYLKRPKIPTAVARDKKAS